MSAIERQAVALAHGVVPLALYFVDALWDEACAVAVVLMVAVVFLRGVKGLLLLVLGSGVGGWGRRGGGEGGAFEMEAEEGVAEEVVEGRPRAVPVVG